MTALRYKLVPSIGKYIIIGIFCLALTSGAFSAKAETIKMAVGEWPPFITELEFGYGVTAQKIIQAYKKEGIDIIFEFMPWARALERTRQGEYVATFPWEHTSTRAENFILSHRPIQVNQTVGFFRQDRFPGGISGRSMEEIVKGKYRIVGVNSYARTEEVKRWAPQKLHVVSSARLAWKVLNSNRADIYFDDLIVGQRESLESLGAQAAGLFGYTQVLKEKQMYLLFSRNHPKSAQLQEIWDSAYVSN